MQWLLGDRRTARKLCKKVVGQSLVEYIHRTSPNVQIVKLTLLPPCFGKQVGRTNARVGIRHVIVDVHGMSVGHWPKGMLCKSTITSQILTHGQISCRPVAQKHGAYNLSLILQSGTV